MGLKFNLPKGWKYESDEEISEMINTGKELLNDEQKTKIELSEINSVYLVLAENSNTGDNLSIMTEKMITDITTELFKYYRKAVKKLKT